MLENNEAQGGATRMLSKEVIVGRVFNSVDKKHWLHGG